MMIALLGERYRLGERLADGSMGSGTLVGTASLLLAWRPPSGLSDPPAGRSGRQLNPQACVDNGDEDD
jgi:hypothetical protein